MKSSEAYTGGAIGGGGQAPTGAPPPPLTSKKNLNPPGQIPVYAPAFQRTLNDWKTNEKRCPTLYTADILILNH